MIVNGDMVNYGEAAWLDTFDSVFAKQASDPWLYTGLGNHDYHTAAAGHVNRAMQRFVAHMELLQSNNLIRWVNCGMRDNVRYKRALYVSVVTRAPITRIAPSKAYLSQRGGHTWRQ
jgi:hypothetical protein